MSLPGAAELFRPTQGDPAARPDDGTDASTTGSGLPDHSTLPTSLPTSPASPGGSGRVRHDEKITVYVSTDELLALEQARLLLRAEHATAVDRGRIVREAVSMALEQLSRDGRDSELVRRLTTP